MKLHKDLLLHSAMESKKKRKKRTSTGAKRRRNYESDCHSANDLSAE